MIQGVVVFRPRREKAGTGGAWAELAQSFGQLGWAGSVESGRGVSYNAIGCRQVWKSLGEKTWLMLLAF